MIKRNIGHDYGILIKDAAKISLINDVELMVHNPVQHTPVNNCEFLQEDKRDNNLNPYAFSGLQSPVKNHKTLQNKNLYGWVDDYRTALSVHPVDLDLKFMA